MWLKSDAFGGGGAIPRRYTCDGENLSPPLAWGDVPAGARSLVILCEDPDAPGGTFRHWAAYDIPTSQHGFKEGVVEASGVPQALNDFRRAGYGGPCPPHGHGPHRYMFRLLAISRDKLGLPPHPPCRAVERAARAALLKEAVLIGTYGR